MKNLNKPASSVSTRLLLAALFWNIAATVLVARGLTVLLISTSLVTTILLVLLASALGLLKARFVLDRVAQKAAIRIKALQDGCVLGFFSLKSWGMILAMMGLGIILRLLNMHLKTLSVIYLIVAAALLFSSRIFWQEYKKTSGMP